MRYDLELFEALNEEYRERPIYRLAALAKRRQMLAPTAQDRAVGSRQERVEFARKRQLEPILSDVDLRGADVLEVGCGHGYLAASLVEHAEVASATGVDIVRYPSWDEHEDHRLRLIIADISRDQTFPSESFDFIVSQVAFEHVTRPLQMLASVHALLRDGGTAWLRMNVYTARNASHCYREVFFPWPHLLFDDDVVGKFYAKHHGTPCERFAWINRMTVAHYLHATQSLGFNIVKVDRRVSPIDVPFYLRFIDKLGRYQALDLETDFLTIVLTKGAPDEVRTAAALKSVDYLERQRSLEAAILNYEENRGASPFDAPATTPVGQQVATAAEGSAVPVPSARVR